VRLLRNSEDILLHCAIHEVNDLDDASVLHVQARHDTNGGGHYNTPIYMGSFDSSSWHAK
jgi:hypothetical protein